MTPRERRPRSQEARPDEDSQYEIVFEGVSTHRGSLAGLATKLGAVAGRIGEIVGEGYARATKLVLAGVERLEDDAAERRFRRRRRTPGARVSASLPRAAHHPVRPRSKRPAMTRSSKSFSRSTPRSQAAARAAAIGPDGHAHRAAEPGGECIGSGRGLTVDFPNSNTIRFASAALFGKGSSFSRDFAARAFSFPEVGQVAVDVERNTGEIVLTAALRRGDGKVRDLARVFSSEAPAAVPNASSAFDDAWSQGPSFRLQRFGHRLSTWTVRHELPGRVRFYHRALYRRRGLCDAIEREFMNTFGIDRYSVNEFTATVLVSFDPSQIQKRQLVELLDDVLRKATDSPVSPVDLDLPLCATSVALALASTYVAPALAPLSAGVFLYSVIPSFKNAYDVVVRERRLGVDVLDAIVVLSCLASGRVLAGTVLGLTLGVARKLVSRTEDQSKKMLLNVFGKQPRFAWLDADGVEVETPLDKLKVNDVIIVHTGETMPVDGEVLDGIAMVDQHTLTGESAPVEKIKGDRVLASTMLIGGKLRVLVTSAGSETTSAKLAQILNDTAGYKLKSQSRGEALADRAVAPTLALGALGLATIGVDSAVAVVNCDLGTGIRMAAPIAMLSSLTLAAERGILVKDGRALELLRNVDTVLFDKTGTLTRERPEVGRILTFANYGENEILRWAAAAEGKFSHPIARAILDKFATLHERLPAIDESKYHVGYGIAVGVDGHSIHVGSARFMTHEGIALPDSLQAAMDSAHEEGHSLVMVAVDHTLGGAIELRAAERPEAAAVIAGLRARGVKHLAIVSGDNDRPTRKLAERLGIDRYFAEVLPQDKAKYVELLQSEGRTVCFIGDGVNDSIALKKSNVSISLRGASSIATDTAQVVLMEESLTKVLQLFDVSIELHRLVNRCWGLILVPNAICIAGAFVAGFGVAHSMVFNQIGGMLAVTNGLLPLREAAKIRAAKERTLAI